MSVNIQYNQNIEPVHTIGRYEPAAFIPGVGNVEVNITSVNLETALEELRETLENNFVGEMNNEQTRNRIETAIQDSLTTNGLLWGPDGNAEIRTSEDGQIDVYINGSRLTLNDEYEEVRSGFARVEENLITDRTPLTVTFDSESHNVPRWVNGTSTSTNVAVFDDLEKLRQEVSELREEIEKLKMLLLEN